LRKLRHCSGPLVAWIFTFTAAAYHLVRLRTCSPHRPEPTGDEQPRQRMIGR
jgi:hypothetical protein